MAEATTGALSPEKNESIFRNDILPDYLPETMHAVQRPRLILLGGQPGAGKTAVLIASHGELTRSGATIRIVGDDLRSYHPQFLAFQRRDPETASQFTQMDAGRWTEKLLAAACARKVNTVFETSMRTPENVARVIGVARDAGYQVEIRAVAVNPRLSWQATHHRYEEMLRVGDGARLPPQHVHDAAVDGLRVSLEKVESEQLVDRVQLSTRGGKVLYENERHGAAWSRAPSARQALEQEQSRPLSRSEVQRFADDWSYILGRMEERQAPDNRIAAIRIRAVADVTYLVAQRRDADGEDRRGRARTIFQNRGDALGLFVELYDNAVRDAERRPVGNVEAHALGRLTQTFMTLKLVEAARDLGLLPQDGKFEASGAFVQDKRATQEFPAAHRLPGDLVIETPDGSRRRLAEHFEVTLNRIAIDRAVFAPTDRMSRLANVADAWAEAAGMRKTLARAANAVAGGMAADTAMTRIVEPGYAAAIAQANRRLERNMSYAERAAISAAIVAENGEPMRATRDDLRLRTADLENRARAKAMIGVVLTEMARHDRLPLKQRVAAEAFAQGIAENEERLRLVIKRGTDRATDQDRALDQRSALIPARHLPDLTEQEIAERLQTSSRLADKRAEIENLSRLVFGNSQVVSAPLDRIVDAKSGAAAGDALRTGRMGELAGEGRKWLRPPDRERQAAEAHAPRLAAALVDYGLAVEFEKHQIAMHHRDDQARQRVEIPSPSKALAAALASESEDRWRSLKKDDGLSRELERLSVAMTKRLSPAELAGLKSGDAAAFATKHGIDEAQGLKAGKMMRQVRSAQQDLATRARERSRLEAITLTRR
jgi:predicted ABC-type ATPase